MKQALINRIGRRAREERGFTMLLALFVLVITTVLVTGAFIAVLGDAQLSRVDVDQHRAYEAALAGIEAYNYQLNQNESYWQTCATLPSNAASGGWTTVPGSTDAGGGSESYQVTPLPASTAPANDDKCDPNNALVTMIEGSAAGTSSGTFRIASTGRSGTNPTIQRTVVAQYRPPSFLNYVYYTDYETTDPSALPGDPSDCAVHYPNRGSDCGGPINFITGDQINGPLHSEDTLAICGSPVFGRSGHNDAVEAAGTAAESQGCSNNPTINTASGKINPNATSIIPPPDNSQLLSVAESSGGYHFTGKTTIVLNGTTMTVTNAAAGDNNTSMPFPTDGVVYVSTASTGCGVTYTPFNPSYTNDSSCGNVYVKGNYTTSLTIASDNDIIINGSICNGTTCSGTPSGNALLGLIANDFVRIYHPLSGSRGSTAGNCGSATNSSADLTNPSIYAAILAVNHSFIVDNYDCGSALGTLYVYGAIAQLFRGPVGTGGSGGATSGYVKSYNYDDRLSSEEPPYFLDPVSAQWTVSRETECAASSSSC